MEVSLIGIKIAIIAMAMNMALFVLPLVINMVNPNLRNYFFIGFIAYGLIGAIVLFYLAFRIKDK